LIASAGIDSFRIYSIVVKGWVGHTKVERCTGW
jgi:hypothetical protein